MRQKTNLFSPHKKIMLHVAPEECLSNIFRKSDAIDYISVNLSSDAMLQVDLTKMYFPDETFDVIYASYVFEHILDDRKAMCQVFRVLKTSGWAILQVPINSRVTYEDPTIVEPKERERAFGQSDHVRIYGEDYYNRLSQVGFIVHREKLPLQENPSAAKRLGLFSSEEVVFCIKA